MVSRASASFSAEGITTLGGADDPTVDPDMETGPSQDPVPPACRIMRAAVREAGHAIFDTALDDPRLRGMGTTLTAMLFDDGRMHLVHAGDSRGFLFRDGVLEQLTEDHSWIWEQVKAGAMTLEEARESKFRHIITRSVGFERDVDVDGVGVTVRAGDCFLLCSDGMSNYVTHEELARVLGSRWYRRAPEALIDMANERGGDDNITVVVVAIANDAGAD
jgi:serine/threonine protein phosphatase PrpC